MKTSVEPLEGNIVKLTVTIPSAEVDKAIADAYAEVAKKVRIPGFRSGKAPRPMIDTYIGRERVLADALEEVVGRYYTKAIDAEGVRPIDQPEMGELAGLVEGEDYEFVAEIPVRPELGLTKGWQDLTCTIEPNEVRESAIDEQVEQLRDKFASLEVVEDRGLQIGDFALLSFVGLVDGEPYEGNTADKFLYESGKGQMPTEFDDALVGAKPGDEVRATLTIPETSARPDFVGKTATFDITVHEIKAKVLPELNAEFAENAGGFDSMEQLRGDVQERLARMREFDYSRERERSCRIALADHLEGEIPEQMVTDRRDSMIRDFFGNLEQRGISLKDYVNAVGTDPEKIQQEIEDEARSRVRQELALEALFRAEGMEVTDEDIDQDLEEMAASSGKTPEELRQQWEEAGVLAVLNEQVMHRKAAEWLLDHVNIVEQWPEEKAETAEEKPAKPKKPRKSAKKKEEE